MSNIDTALNSILSGENTAILGGGGRGKSHLINSLSNFFDGCMLKVGPTGSSALNIGGSTAHRCFGLAMEPYIEGVTLKRNLKRERAAVLKSDALQMLVIDEVGAVRSDKLTELDFTLRKYRDKTKPFGGLQTIVVGDYLQLAPVVTDNDKKILSGHYNSPYAFDSPAYKEAQFNTVVLSENFRQSNQEQQKMLDYLRLGENKELVVEYLNDLCYNKQSSHKDCVILAPTNKVVEEHNDFHLANLKGSAKIFKAVVRGDFKEEPSPKLLSLKVGARVLTTVNDEEGKYVNGSSGTVIDIFRNEVTVELDNGETIILKPKTQHNIELYADMTGQIKERIIGSYTQIPLRLGAAISIHRSQGMTIDNVSLQMNHYPLFGNSMLYVAVSRCRDLDNLSINRRLTVKDIVVDNYVCNYMKSLIEEV
jgi:ATP-dependent exoDNAse (exonuclease V) alpha subunit